MRINAVNKIPLSFLEDDAIEAALSSAPSTPGDTVVRLKLGWLSGHSKEQLEQALQSIQQAAIIIKAATNVHRVGLVTTSDDEVRLIPFHGLSAEWKPTADLDEEYNNSYPGYISPKNGPKSSNATLDEIQRQITGENIPAMDLTYLGNANEDTANSIFAKITRGELEQWRLGESASHVAFLTPFSNTPGFTVLVPRKPLGSDILAMAEPDLRELAAAIWDVSHLLQSSAALGASRVGLIFEGMEIDYAHAKLIPILDKGLGNLDQHVPEAAFTDVYTGSISSRPGPPSDIDVLQELQVRLLRAAETRKS
ncbi:putative HIT-like protein [Lasiodiplodia hormozganensis]|uniref:HIT-like protein n=1 Tax=Lasiodiplodia hormozganensis TaxID=869390 RepID=A0AA39Y346_9PEZI|nr:putative HIT-like protein [Lasiodiplodia hormozganensis]